MRVSAIIPVVPSSANAMFAWIAAACLLVTARGSDFAAAGLPNRAIDGFVFPETEAALTAQVATMTRSASAEDRGHAANAIYQHAWGLWTAVTTFGGRRYHGDSLRVYETWQSLTDLLAPPANTLTAPEEPTPQGSAPQRGHSTLTPRRLTLLRLRLVSRSSFNNPTETDPLADRIIGAVKFNPPAAAHIQEQDLLHGSTLAALLDGGAVQVPPFPATALVAKPVYQIVSPRELVGGRYYLLKVWSGPPATPQAWGPDKWTAGVWIDLQGDGSGDGAVDMAPAADGTTRTEATTYPLDDFIHHRLSPADATALNQANGALDVNPGDVALLVAMHIAGRELARWTWQTFWWTPDSTQPPIPSSAEIAAARPSQLAGAARHYAMALAYSMVAPVQPYTGGTNATAVYAYNPWIEARFAPSDLPDSIAGVGPDGQPAANNTGVQTNCLSCHAQATFHSAQLSTAPAFTGARYVDLGDPAFVGTLQTEFLWTLATHAQ